MSDRVLEDVDSILKFVASDKKSRVTFAVTYATQDTSLVNGRFYYVEWQENGKSFFIDMWAGRTISSIVSYRWDSPNKFIRVDIDKVENTITTTCPSADCASIKFQSIVNSLAETLHYNLISAVGSVQGDKIDDVIRQLKKLSDGAPRVFLQCDDYFVPLTKIERLKLIEFAPNLFSVPHEKEDESYVPFEAVVLKMREH